jgi:hypothetical protein
MKKNLNYLVIILSVICFASCTSSNVDVEGPQKPASLAAWLDANPTIKDAIRLENSNLPAPSFIGGGTLSETSWANWSATDKQALSDAFDRAWTWLYETSDPTHNLGTDEFTMPLSCPNCENLLLSNPGDTALTVIDETTAKTAFFASVAHSLAVEIGGAVSWSVLNSDAATLQKYFNSRSMMHRNNSTTDFIFGSPLGLVDQRVKYIGNSTPATPRYTYAWLVNQGLLKSTHQATIEALLQWARENLSHYYLTSTYTNNNDHWQYPSRPPVSRVIEGTIYAGDPGLHHWTAGCHGTAGFLKSVLKSVNIPVEPLYVCGHAQLYFPSIGKYLDHGDDPYNANVKNSSLPIANLFLDQATHTAWFSATPDFLDVSDPLCANIGRRTTEF